MRQPSARGLGVRYLIAVLLPFSGLVLVIYTAVQLGIAHATHTVPPPRRIAEASIPDNFIPPPVEREVARPAPATPSDSR